MVQSCCSSSATLLLVAFSSVRCIKAQGECVPEAVVGTCVAVGCFNGHGSGVACHTTSCLCNPGYCSRDGNYCEKAPPTTTEPVETTTDIFDQFDICGVREYMQRGEFHKQVAMCALTECAQHWSDTAKAQCCGVGCSAKTLKEDLPDCWPNIAGAMRRFEVTKKAGLHACQIPGIIEKVVENLPKPKLNLGLLGLVAPPQADDPEMSYLVGEVLRVTANTTALAVLSGRSAAAQTNYLVGAGFVGCVMGALAVMAAVKFCHRARSIQQQPLLD